MVLLAAAICTKEGKPLLSRQFVEMTRSRIEGLLAAFPKLIGSDLMEAKSSSSKHDDCKQHTFVETESVRYVYQPLEKLYILLITTKASNILEDLETLRLFARVIPEYSKGVDESDILNDCYNIIFAFDEIVALGYRESVTLSQIRTFTEMDSHEEKVFQAARETQEREAKANMKRRARELELARRDAHKRGIKPSGMGGGSYGGFGGGSGGGSGVSSSSLSEMGMGADTMTNPTPAPHSVSRPATSGPNRAMKLGSKHKDADSFVDQLKAEGEVVVDLPAANRYTGGSAAAVVAHTPQTNQEGVHARIEEKLTVVAGRDGGLNSMELIGILQVKINQAEMTGIRLHVRNEVAASRNAQMQTHPNIDKKVFQNSNWLQAKANGKPYPLGQEVGVLKWRLQTQDESCMPLTINCWPNVSSNIVDVNIEYELQDESLELNDVLISIPLPSNSGAPNVSECEGDYTVSRGHLEWRLALIDADNKSGTLEFSVKSGHTDDFFPVVVSFVSQKSYCGIEVAEVQHPSQGEVKFSTETAFFTEKYEIS